MDTFSPNVKVENHLYFLCHADTDRFFPSSNYFYPPPLLIVGTHRVSDNP